VSREDFIAVASRLFAIFLLVLIARSIPSAIALIGQEGPQPSLALIAVVISSGLILCAILWLFPLTIARKLLPVMKQPISGTPMTGTVALSVGLTLVGIWILATAIPDTFYWATIFLLSRKLESGYFEWGHENIALVVTTIAQLALAVWLIFGSSGIVRLIERFRYGPNGGAV
jgi:hypothetical protein